MTSKIVKKNFWKLFD